jgi:hypothetical protein
LGKDLHPGKRGPDADGWQTRAGVRFLRVRGLSRPLKNAAKRTEHSLDGLPSVPNDGDHPQTQ